MPKRLRCDAMGAKVSTSHGEELATWLCCHSELYILSLKLKAINGAQSLTVLLCKLCFWLKNSEALTVAEDKHHQDSSSNTQWAPNIQACLPDCTQTQ